VDTARRRAQLSGVNLPIHSERPGRILGVIGGAVGLFALTRPFGNVDGVAVSLGRIGALGPALALATLAVGAMTFAGGVLAFADPARGEQLIGTAAGLLLVGVAVGWLVGVAVAPGSATYLVVLGFGLTEAGDLLDPAYTNPHASARIAVAATAVFTLASWRFLLAGDAVEWAAGGVAVLAWLVALGWELTASRE